MDQVFCLACTNNYFKGLSLEILRFADKKRKV